MGLAFGSAGAVSIFSRIGALNSRSAINVAKDSSQLEQIVGLFQLPLRYRLPGLRFLHLHHLRQHCRIDGLEDARQTDPLADTRLILIDLVNVVKPAPVIR